MSTGTTTTGRASFMTAPSILRLGGGKWVFEARCSIVTLSDATNEYDFHIGFINSLTTAPAAATNCACFSYDRNTSVNWIRRTSNGTSQTATASGTAVATGFNTLRIEVDAAAANIEFFVNGTSIGTNTATLPNASGDEVGVGAFLLKSASTTARTVLIDYIQVTSDFTTARL